MSGEDFVTTERHADMASSPWDGKRPPCGFFHDIQITGKFMVRSSAYQLDDSLEVEAKPAKD